MSYNRHYCYEIKFADGYTYFGSRTCHCQIATDSYTGSPATHAAKWQTDMPRVKTVVSVHATRRLANEAEAKLILSFWAHSKPLSLNAYVHSVGFNTYGYTHTAETKAKLSEAKLGNANALSCKHTDKAKAKIAEAQLGNTNVLGCKLTAEHKAKLSEAKLGKKLTAKTKERMSEAKLGNTNVKGRKWYTDGVASVMLKPSATVPDGFWPGRSKRRQT